MDWDEFLAEYRANVVYWYFPQGKQVSSPDLQDIFSVFAEFDGERWPPEAILARLHAKGLSSGDTALPRQQKRVFENLGFCWLDDAERLRITPAGMAFSEAANPTALIERHLWRYQLANPFNDRSDGIKLFPHIFLLNVILRTEGYLSQDEFKLFVARAQRPGDWRQSVFRIEKWRQLPRDEQLLITEELRGSVLDVLDNNATYAMGFHRAASYFISNYRAPDGRSGLAIEASRRNAIIGRLKQMSAELAWIPFKSKADCIGFYGDLERGANLLNAVEYYVDRSQVRKAVQAFEKLPRELRDGRSVEEFEEVLFLEKDLEDYLEHRLGLIEPGLVPEGGGRQVATTVGPIDLLARSTDGDLVVIELKKGRAADKVFGQICRYIGCLMKETAAEGQSVRGYIVGSEIDPKLKFAVLAVPSGKVRLRRFVRDETSEPPIWIDEADA